MAQAQRWQGKGSSMQLAMQWLKHAADWRFPVDPLVTPGATLHSGHVEQLCAGQ
jgi:hypothetical protein